MLTALLLPLAVSLVLTLALEALLAALWGMRERRDILLLLGANLLTNPAVVLFYYTVSSGIAAVVLTELAAVALEAAIYRRWSHALRPALLFSLCANVFSFCCGLLLNYAAQLL